MDRDLEKFRGGPNKPAQYPMRVSISRASVITFNKNAYAQMGKPAAVYLYFSRVRDMIAMEPVHSLNMPEAFPVMTKNTSGFRINAASFCTHFGIRISQTLRFIDPEINNGKLELKLGDTVSVAYSRRKSKIER
jgi:hypothetical protein